MKKILLTLAAISLAAGAWAAEIGSVVPDGYIDVTPSYYKFYKNENLPLDQLLRDDVKSGAQVNLGNTSLISENTGKGENYFSEERLAKGNLIYRAGGYFTDVQPCPLKKAFSTYNFGGEIGNVLVINGKGSNLDQAIKEYYKLDAAPELSKMEANFGNFQLMWVADHPTMNKEIEMSTNIRVRLEFNIYNEDMSSNEVVLTQFLYQDEQGNAQSAVLTPDAKISEFALDNNGAKEWNPNRWMVLEFECPYNRIASYIRTHVNFTNCPAMQNGAFLIRSIEIYGLPSASYKSDYTVNTIVKSWNDYTPEAKFDPIESISLAHGQEGNFELSGGENAELTFSVTPAEGYDPATVFSVATANNNAAHVSVSEVKDGKFTVSVSENAVKSESPVKISVAAGDVKSNEVELNHFAAPANVALAAHETLLENEISMPANHEAVEYKINVESKLDSKEGAYQKFVLKADANNFADIALNDAGDAVVVTPKAAGKATFTLTPLKAGEAKASAEPSADATTYTVTIGTSGIESIEVTSGEVEYFNLKGVKVANPEKGIYIKKEGNKTTKVIL